MRGQFTGMLRAQCTCGHVSNIRGLQPGVWLWKCWYCERSRAIGPAFYDLPSGPRIQPPRDLSIPADPEEQDVQALPGFTPNNDTEAMPKSFHDSEMWYPGRPITQHILEDGTRTNVGRTPRRK